MSRSDTIRKLNRLISSTCKILIALVLLQYMWMIFCSRMAGVKMYSYARVERMFSFERINFTLDEIQFAVDDGYLFTASRAGEENYIVLIGKGGISWPSQPHLKKFTKVRISLNKADLKQVLQDHADALQDASKDPSAVFLAKRKVRDLLDEHFDRFQIPGLEFSTLSLFTLPAPGGISFKLYDRDDDLGDYMSRHARTDTVRLGWLKAGSWGSRLAMIAALLLFLTLLSSVFLAYFIYIGKGVLSAARGLKRLGSPGLSPWTRIRDVFPSLGSVARHRRTLVLLSAAVALLVIVWYLNVPFWLYVWTHREDPGYKVSFDPKDLYAVENFRLRIAHSEFEVEQGTMALGRIKPGVTVVVILGDGQWYVPKPAAYEWKDIEGETPKGPFTDRFSSIYLRIRPDYYEKLTKDMRLTPIRDQRAFQEAREIYRHKFWNSWHTNDRALIPYGNVGTVDIESVTYGRLQILEDIGRVPFLRPWVHHWDYEGDPPWYMD